MPQLVSCLKSSFVVKFPKFQTVHRSMLVRTILEQKYLLEIGSNLRIVNSDAKGIDPYYNSVTHF